jgi:hypothetical protein
MSKAQDLINDEGKVLIRFLHEAASHYNNDDEDIYETLETWYEADTWQEACNDAADCWDWDDEDVVNFSAESDMIETTRDLDKIEYQNAKKEWIEVPIEVYEFFSNAENEAWENG